MCYLKFLYIDLSGENIGKVIVLEEFTNHFRSYKILDSEFTS